MVESGKTTIGTELRNLRRSLSDSVAQQVALFEETTGIEVTSVHCYIAEEKQGGGLDPPQKKRKIEIKLSL